MGYIYQIINQVNGKIYVGKTKHSLKKRFYGHKWNASHDVDTPLYRAMRKHGIDNFTIQIIEECSNLNEREIHWIEQLSPEYNVTKGGDGGDTSSSPAFQDWVNHIKTSGLMAGANNPMYGIGGMLGKQHTEITKEKQSQARKKHWDEMTTKDRIERGKKIAGTRNGMFGKSPKNSVPVVFNGIEYPSIAAAARSTGVAHSTIKKHGVMNGK